MSIFMQLKSIRQDFIENNMEIFLAKPNVCSTTMNNFQSDVRFAVNICNSDKYDIEKLRIR